MIVFSSNDSRGANATGIAESENEAELHFSTLRDLRDNLDPQVKC